MAPFVSDAHGSGPWLPIETADSLEVVDWIVRQSWCNGKVGTWGISYEGTRAMLTAMANHPSIVATCPMFVFLNIYRVRCRSVFPRISRCRT